MNIKEKIGERIRFLRGTKELSQKDLSYRADLDRSYIASVEKGHRNISIMNIEKICNALNISISSFFNDKLFD